MNAGASPPKIVLIESNVLLAKRLVQALKQEGFEVVHCNQPVYALTMLEWNAPAAILCATNLREMPAFEMAGILRADAKTAHIPVLALGEGGGRALLEALRAGCEDYVDRRRDPADIAAHVRNFLLSRQGGFQPTQMLGNSETALSGTLSHLELSGVIQMLSHAHQTGALHVNAGETDGVIFFDAGQLCHAECGSLFGDEAVIHIIQSCEGAGAGVYKFVYGATATSRTVLRAAADLLLDAVRALDESRRETSAKEPR